MTHAAFGERVPRVACSAAAAAFVRAMADVADRLAEQHDLAATLEGAAKEARTAARAGTLPILTPADLIAVNDIASRVWCVSTPAPAQVGPRLRALIDEVPC